MLKRLSYRYDREDSEVSAVVILSTTTPVNRFFSKSLSVRCLSQQVGELSSSTAEGQLVDERPASLKPATRGCTAIPVLYIQWVAMFPCQLACNVVVMGLQMFLERNMLIASAASNDLIQHFERMTHMYWLQSFFSLIVSWETIKQKLPPL